MAFHYDSDLSATLPRHPSGSDPEFAHVRSSLEEGYKHSCTRITCTYQQRQN